MTGAAVWHWKSWRAWLQNGGWVIVSHSTQVGDPSAVHWPKRGWLQSERSSAVTQSKTSLHCQQARVTG